MFEGTHLIVVFKEILPDCTFLVVEGARLIVWLLRRFCRTVPFFPEGTSLIVCCLKRNQKGEPQFWGSNGPTSTKAPTCLRDWICCEVPLSFPCVSHVRWTELAIASSLYVDVSFLRDTPKMTVFLLVSR